MNIKELKELIKDIPDDVKVLLNAPCAGDCYSSEKITNTYYDEGERVMWIQSVE